MPTNLWDKFFVLIGFKKPMTDQAIKSSWTYTGEIDLVRKANLDQAPSWSLLVDNLCSNSMVLCVHEEPSTDEPGAFRFRYCIELKSELFDQFFNSHNGYRAGYFISEELGLNKNAHFINKIIPKLVEACPPRSEHHFLLIKAYSFPSSKVWLTEWQKKGLTEEMKNCPKCIPEWPDHNSSNIIKIMNGIWESSHNSIGSNAFNYTKLWIFSAFIRENGTEWVSLKKKERAKDIHETGWS